MEHNVVALSSNDNFNTCPAYEGTGNTFSDNCVWMADGTSGIAKTNNVTVANDVSADPKLVADWKAGTAKVTNATCTAKLPPGSRFLP